MQPDPLSTTFAALADPTRRAILSRLALGETSVMDLAEPFDISLPAISKHLKVLEHAGLISRGREAQWRPCRIAPVSLREVDGWLGNFRRFWDENFNRLDDYLEELKANQAVKAERRTNRKPKNKQKPKKEKQRGRKSR
jgi:DNA-binding transcriptional ArsR family regulator